jgi:hypothetical protein
MTARAISIEAYHAHVDDGGALVQWVYILHFLKNDIDGASHGRTRAELAARLNIRVASVCGRVNELLEAGLIVELDRRKCIETGAKAHPLFDAERQWRLF